ncbi:MAG: hypothetical protein SFT94_08330 [Pseudanabaenaceae cyanobacterium bins.68]|nr:hypothetical protein [Pseudanabaenaceae cyanobacterium bins.68]
MYVYIHPRIAKIANADQMRKLEAIAQAIEQGNPLIYSLLFSPRHSCWVKRLTIRYRILAKLVIIDGTEVFCLTHLLQRGGREYPEFLDNCERFRDQHMQIPQSSLRDFLHQRQQEQLLPPVPILPAQYYEWLRPPRLMRASGDHSCPEISIYESRLWVEQWRNSASPLLPFLGLAYELLCSLLGISQQPSLRMDGKFTGLQIVADQNRQLSLVFSVIHPRDQPHRQIILLYQAFLGIPEYVDQAKIGKELELFGTTVERNHLEYSLELDQIARRCCRCYPDYLVCEQQLWQNLETSQDSNLALSGEEEQLLQQIRFPAFINGRAGSGKSTMLHFAFAYYCRLYLEAASESAKFHPLFLTYSDRLTEKAHRTVSQILSSHSRYIELGLHQAHDLIEKIKPCFRSFQSLLFEHLPPEQLAFFPAEKYVSFYRFKQLFDRAFPSNRIAAETAWHAIRTYIKGYGYRAEQGDFLEPEDYEKELPTSHKDLPDQIFRQIHQINWRWYRNQQQEYKYWDDQDLVIAVLRYCQSLPKYAAIFCDESQDFTRVELQLILRLSIWSNYQLQPPIPSLPFAFAGDPLQTLNPTGFNWRSFKSSFHEQILIPLDPHGYLGLCDHRAEHNYQLYDLQSNYRSTPSVVKFANSVHLVRRSLLKGENISPQNPWNLANGSPLPQKGIFNGVRANMAASELQQILETPGVITILPCDHGGETAFLWELKNRFSHLESLLTSLGINSADAPRPPSVFSTTLVKGLEHTPVILLGFGEYFSRNFRVPLDQIRARRAETQDQLALAYFLNKLYVALTRSQRVLGIIDSEDGDRNLWQSFSSMDQWLESLSERQAQEDWSNLVAPLANSFTVGIYSRGNSLELARSLLYQALEIEDRELFRSAAVYYQQANLAPESEYCKLWLVRLEGDLLKAGQELIDLQGISETFIHPEADAWQCFWQGKHWEELLNWADRYPDQPNTKYLPAIQFMVHLHVSEFLNFAQQHLWQISPSDRSNQVWQHIYLTYSQTVQQQIPELTDLESHIAILQQLAQLGIHRDHHLDLAAQCCYQLQNYQQAVAQWEACQDLKYLNHQTYFLAKAQITALPYKLEFLAKAKQYQTIVNLYQQHHQAIGAAFDPAWETVESELRLALNLKNQWLDLTQIDLSQGLWVQAMQTIKQHGQSFGFEHRAEILNTMANAQAFSSQAIAREIDQKLNAKSPNCVKVLDTFVDQDFWIGSIFALKKRDQRNSVDISPEQISSLTADRRQLLSEFLLTLTQAQQISDRAQRKFQEFCQHQRSQIEPILANLVESAQNQQDSIYHRLTQPWQQISSDQAQRYQENLIKASINLINGFITSTINQPEWQENLKNLTLVDLAYTKLGEFAPHLSFLERFRRHPEPEIREFSYQAWVKVKAHQAKYEITQGRPSNAERIQQEIISRRSEWQLSQVSSPPPAMPAPMLEFILSLSSEELQELENYLEFIKYKRSQ